MKNKGRIVCGVLMVLAIVALGLFFYWGYAPAPDQPALRSVVQEKSLPVGGVERTYLSYVPADTSAGMPLVIVLHGTGIDGAKIREWTGYEFDLMADQHHFAVAYPDGIGNGWNDIGRGEASKAKKENIDDVAFLKELVAYYQQEYHVDPHRVYAFGYSNGGAMIFRMMAEAPALFARVATVAAALPTEEDRLLPLADSVPPIMMVNGMADPIIPVDGGKIWFFGQNRGRVISAHATAETFAGTYSDAQVTNEVTLQHRDAKDQTFVTEQSWMHQGGPVVILYIVHGGGHVVPQPSAKFPRFLGSITRDLDAPRQAVEFFKLVDNK